MRFRFLRCMKSTSRTVRELTKAKDELASVRRAYRAGGYSGHPEDMLELIEDREHHLALISRSVSEARILDWHAIDQAHAARFEFYDRYAGIRWADLPPEYKDEEAAMVARLDGAWASDLSARGLEPAL